MEFFEIEKTWPDWKATRLIGEGSFGKVYEIVRSNFGIEEHCALKVITIPSSKAELQSMKNEGMDEASATEYYRGLVEEFVQEIALMSKLKGNVNVVGYEDYAVVEHTDSIGWDILIRMELLTPLPAYIQDHPFTINDTIKLAIDMCNALDVCHSQKIIHRDLKPDNIFISQNGDYKLGDFGVARTIEKTVSGLSKKGTYTYMAPEVYKGEAYGTNVDLYSLGIVMYKLLNNSREPFLPPHPETIKYSDKSNALVRRLNGEMIPPPVYGNEFLSRVILKSVSYNSWERYQKPSQMKADLEAVLSSANAGTTPILQADQIAMANTYSQSGSMSQQQVTAYNYPPVTPADPSMSQAYNQSVGAPQQASAYNYTPIPQADPSAPNAYNQSVGAPQQQAPAYNYAQANNAYAPNPYGNPQGMPVQPQQANGVMPPSVKKLKVIKTVGLVLGWVGAPLWLFVLMQVEPIQFIAGLVIVVCMILLSIKALTPQRKIFSIIMLLLSIYTFNALTLAAGILFLCAKKVE